MPSIRDYHQDDRPAVLALYAAVFGESAMADFDRRWNWQFFENPCSGAFESKMWVAEGEAHVIGFLASFGVRFKILDQETIVRFPCDLMVSPDARGRGIGELLIRRYIETEKLIVNALGYSPPSGRMFRRLGYRPVDAERLTVRIRDARPLVRDALRRRFQGRTPDLVTPFVGSCAGFLLNLGLNAVNRFREPVGSAVLDVRTCKSADTSFDELWRRLSSAYPIAAVRDSRWVQWRFLDDPGFEHRLFGAWDSRDTLQGYIDVRVALRRGIRFGRIFDLFCDPRRMDVAGTLLAAGAEYLESERADAITCLGHLPGLRQVIEDYCFLAPGRLQRPALLLWKGDPAWEERIYDAGLWHLTHADGDDGFSP